MNSHAAVVLLLVAVASFVGVTVADSNFPDCSAVKPEENFDGTKLAGVWYVVEGSIEGNLEMTYSCLNDTNTVSADGTFTIVSMLKNGYEVVNATGTPVDGEKAKLSFTSSEINYVFVFLDTDYTTYIVRYACFEGIGNRVEVLSKSKTIDDDSLKTAKDVLKANNLNADLTTVIEDCN